MCLVDYKFLYLAEARCEVTNENTFKYLSISLIKEATLSLGLEFLSHVRRLIPFFTVTIDTPAAPIYLGQRNEAYKHC